MMMTDCISPCTHYKSIVQYSLIMNFKFVKISVPKYKLLFNVCINIYCMFYVYFQFYLLLSFPRTCIFFQLCYLLNATFPYIIFPHTISFAIKDKGILPKGRSPAGKKGESKAPRTHQVMGSNSWEVVTLNCGIPAPRRGPDTEGSKQKKKIKTYLACKFFTFLTYQLF